LESTDDDILGNMNILPNEQDSFLRFPVSRVNVDICVSFDPDVISNMDIPGPVDHHSGFDVDIFP
jgi:hypothetical protein